MGKNLGISWRGHVAIWVAASVLGSVLSADALAEDGYTASYPPRVDDGSAQNTPKLLPDSPYLEKRNQHADDQNSTHLPALGLLADNSTTGTTPLAAAPQPQLSTPALSALPTQAAPATRAVGTPAVPASAAPVPTGEVQSHKTAFGNMVSFFNGSAGSTAVVPAQKTSLAGTKTIAGVSTPAAPAQAAVPVPVSAPSVAASAPQPPKVQAQNTSAPAPYVLVSGLPKKDAQVDPAPDKVAGATTAAAPTSIPTQGQLAAAVQPSAPVPAVTASQAPPATRKIAYAPTLDEVTAQHPAPAVAAVLKPADKEVANIAVPLPQLKPQTVVIATAPMNAADAKAHQFALLAPASGVAPAASATDQLLPVVAPSPTVIVQTPQATTTITPPHSIAPNAVPLLPVVAPLPVGQSVIVTQQPPAATPLPSTPLSVQSKHIADTIPPEKKTQETAKAPVDLEHFHKTALDDPEIMKHEGIGIKISVQRPKADISHMLEDAYDALIAGNQEDAISLYKEVLDRQPSNTLALFGLATTYHRAGQLQLARPLYGKLLAIDPKNKEGLNNFLVLLADESPKEALGELGNLERSHPGFSPVPAQIAIIYEKMGDYPRATQAMSRAIALSPENLKYQYDMAIILDKQGSWPSAASIYQQLLTASERGEKIPANPEEIQERLTFIRSNGTKG